MKTKKGDNMKKLAILVTILFSLVSFSFANVSKETLQTIDNMNIQSIVKIEGNIIFRDKVSGTIVESVGWSGSGWVKDCTKNKDGTYRIEIGTAWHVLDANMFYDQIYFGKVKNWDLPYSVLFTIIYPDGTKVSFRDKQLEGYYLAVPDFGYLVYKSKIYKKPVKINTYFEAARGDSLIGITCPYGIPFVLSEGIIGLSRVSVFMEEHNMNRDFILCHTQLAPGSSGGAIFNTDGELVAMCDAGIQSQGASLSLVVPMDFLNNNPKFSKISFILKNHLGKPVPNKFRAFGYTFEYLPYIISR